MLSFDPYADPRFLQGLLRHLADKSFHAFGGLLAHLLGNVAVYVQGETGGGVAQLTRSGAMINFLLQMKNLLKSSLALRYVSLFRIILYKALQKIGIHTEFV